MESALDLWNRRKNESWIEGLDSIEFYDRVLRKQASLKSGSRVLNIESGSTEFIAGVFAAVTHRDPVELFLGSEHWTDRERMDVLGVANPDLVWAETTLDVEPTGNSIEVLPRRLIMIPSGGTTGGLRFAVHTWESLSVATRGLQQWLGGGAINSVCFLPLHHVSGLMQVVRSFVTGGHLWLEDWSEIDRGNFPEIDGKSVVTSLVPSQLERLRHVPAAAAWLRRFHCVFLGGARASASLLAWARDERIRLAPGYGMTETAAQVATVRPEDFLAGGTAAEVLPHAEVNAVDEIDRAPVPAGVAGRLLVRTAALFRGYYPDCGEAQSVFATGDRGNVDADNRLTVIGRLDVIINTGGEKVDPAEVENVILETGLVRSAVVFGVPNEQWGEMVVAAVVGAASTDESALDRRIRDVLAGYKVPKRWLCLETLPLNAAGKIDVTELRRLGGQRD